MTKLDRATLARMRRQIVVSESRCWLWTGRKMPNGYGKFRVPGEAKERAVHRILYEHYVGPIPDGQQLDHLCRVRSCCNPPHFEPVTPAENTLRQEHHHRGKDTCPKGHPYTPENTRRDKRGSRHCKTCDRER